MRIEPRELADLLERDVVLPAGSEERFNGYGVMGLPFQSGHVLALRRFPASSVGPGYTSVWHRDPDNVWRFYADVEPWQACTRFFGGMVAEAVLCPIALSWTGSRSLRIEMDGPETVEWEVVVSATAATRVMGTLGRLLPMTLWRSHSVLAAMGFVAGKLLDVGKVGLHGRAPNGQYFRVNPRLLWVVEASEAVVGGTNLGEPGPLEEQAHLGDFWIPQQGILAFGQAYFENFEATKHARVTSLANSRD